MRAPVIFAGHPQTRLHEGSSWCRVADWLAEWEILSISAYECFRALRSKPYANSSPVHLTHSFAAAPNAQSKPKPANHVRAKEFHNGKHQEPEEAQHHQREVPPAQPRHQVRAEDRHPRCTRGRYRRRRNRCLRQGPVRLPSARQGRLQGRYPQESGRKPQVRRDGARQHHRHR